MLTTRALLTPPNRVEVALREEGANELLDLPGWEPGYARVPLIDAWATQVSWHPTGEWARAPRYYVLYDRITKEYLGGNDIYPPGRVVQVHRLLAGDVFNLRLHFDINGMDLDEFQRIQRSMEDMKMPTELVPEKTEEVPPHGSYGRIIDFDDE